MHGENDEIFQQNKNSNYKSQHRFIILGFILLVLQYFILDDKMLKTGIY